MRETKRCPYCGEEILAGAKKCRHCGEWLNNTSAESYSYSPQETKVSKTLDLQAPNYKRLVIETLIAMVLTVVACVLTIIQAISVAIVTGAVIGVLEICIFNGLRQHFRHIKMPSYLFKLLIDLSVIVICLLVLSLLVGNGSWYYKSPEDTVVLLAIGITLLVTIFVYAVYMCKVGKMFEELGENRLGKAFKIYAVVCVCLHVLSLIFLGLAPDNRFSPPILGCALAFFNINLYLQLKIFFETRFRLQSNRGENK